MKDEKKVFIFPAVFFAVMAFITVLSLPYIKLLSDIEIQKNLKEWTSLSGIWGVAAILGIQVFQVVIAFVPGEPVEILAGVLYGGFGGLLICILGCGIGSILIFNVSKKFGLVFIKKIFGKSKLEKFSFIENSKKLEMVVFVLFLIPGTPKDMLTYVVGNSPMKLSRFLAISIFARIPSIISSTFIGHTVRNGEWNNAVIIFIATATFGIVGIQYRDRAIDFCRRIGRRIRHTN